MAIDYAKIKATAKKLIEENGIAMTFTRKGRTPANVDEPWNGPTTDPMAVSGPPVSYAAVKAVRDEIEYGDGPNGIKSAMKAKLYVCDDSFPDGHVDVKTLDNVNDGSYSWKICYVVPVAPGDTDVIFEMGLEG